MKNWKYTLKIGTQLRETIMKDDIGATCEMLEKAWREIHEQFPEEYDEYDLENDIENIEEVKENEDEDDINYLLGEFYDYCDNTGIWIPLD